MKKIVVLACISFLFIAIIVYLIMVPVLERRNEVKLACEELEFEEWTGCVTSVALEKGNASYCSAAGNVFSPWPKQCMDFFSQQTQDKNSCSTIYKPQLRTVCYARFNDEP